MNSQHETRNPQQKLTMIRILLTTFFITFFCFSGFAQVPNDQPSEHREPSQSMKDHQATEKTFTRPEERGEDFSLKTTDDLLVVIADSKDKIALRKAAQELGDRNINDGLELSASDQKIINDRVKTYFDMCISDDVNVREEARMQIHRLWRLAVPVLLEYIDNENLTKAELSAKSLILMRNEAIIQAMIEKSLLATTDFNKEMLAFFLSKMNEQRQSHIPGRVCMDAAKSAELYNRLVKPALDKMGIKNPGNSNRN